MQRPNDNLYQSNKCRHMAFHHKLSETPHIHCSNELYPTISNDSVHLKVTSSANEIHEAFSARLKNKPQSKLDVRESREVEDKTPLLTHHYHYTMISVFCISVESAVEHHVQNRLSPEIALS